MPDSGGTIFEISARKATRHRAPQATPGVTLCRQKFGRYWSIHHSKPHEDRCRKCYPVQATPKKRRKSWDSST